MAEKFSCEETEMRLVWTSDAPCSWVRIRSSSREKLHSSNKHSFTIEELQRLISWLVDNTFVVNGGVCRRQIIGLPMGTNCAPALCNLCLFAWECQFVERLLEQKRIEEAKSLHMTFRLIDDVLSVGSTCHDEFFNSCYPTFLTLNDTTLEDGSVNFLGMHIKETGVSLSLDVYDKRKDFPFQVVRYPHLDSAIPSSIAYGVFIGQLHRFKLICSAMTSFVRNACNVALTLVRQSSSLPRLRNSFETFCRRKVTRTRWNIKVKELIYLFHDFMEMHLRGLPVPELDRPSDNLPCPRRVDGLAWLTQNFPSFVELSPSFSSGSMSELCDNISQLHLGSSSSAWSFRPVSGSVSSEEIGSPFVLDHSSVSLEGPLQSDKKEPASEGLLWLQNAFPALTLN